MISKELLEIFQQPAAPWEPDMGTVDPLTATELEAIARYNIKTGIIEDCLDGAVVSGGEFFTGHAAEYGQDQAVAYIKTHFGWLREWFEALDTLDSDLRASDGGLSNAAERVMTHEALHFCRFQDQVQEAALRCLIGDAGPVSSSSGRGLMLSNGYIEF